MKTGAEIKAMMGDRPLPQRGDLWKHYRGDIYLILEPGVDAINVGGQWHKGPFVRCQNTGDAGSTFLCLQSDFMELLHEGIPIKDDEAYVPLNICCRFEPWEVGNAESA